nr:sugar-binding domain-containing protein [Liquorilactobacillus satsumensis]
MTYSNSKQIERLIQISELYYEQNYSQKQISEMLHIHRTEISRLLKAARQVGVVKISVAPPINQENIELANFICQNFNLRKAIIVPTENNSNYADDLESISVYTNSLLNELIKDNCAIGMSWGGETIKKVVENFFLSKKAKNISVVPLIGSPMGKLDISCQANHLVHQMSSKIPDSKLFSLDSPVFINSEKIMREILSTETNRSTVRLWQKINIAIVGIGSAKMVDNYNWHAFYQKEGSAGIYQNSMVGDVLSQSFSVEGDEYQEIYPNLVGASLSQLRKMETVIGVAAGERKTEAIVGGLRANLFDVLITTDKVARKIRLA